MTREPPKPQLLHVSKREGLAWLGGGIWGHEYLLIIYIIISRRGPNPADSNKQGSCWADLGRSFVLIPAFPSCPGYQGPVQLLQPQVPPAHQPALLDLSRLPDHTPAQRECYLDCAPGAYQNL